MILDRYLLRLWLGPFIGGLIMVLGVLLLGRALKLLGTVSDSGEAWSLVAQLLVLTMPYFLLLTVPMAFFLSLQNTIAGLQQSSEMDALRASGISYTRMFRSFFGLIVLLWLALTYTSMSLLPQGQLGFNNVLAKMYAMTGVVSFAPQRFTEGFDGVTVYVDGEDDTGIYHGVILEDNRDNISVVYTARTAEFIMSGNALALRMNNGVRLEGSGADQRMLAFDSYRVAIPVSAGKWDERISGNHVTMMTMSELWQSVQHDKEGALAEWNRRWLLPTTVIVLFFFALPLSITQKRSGKAGSMVAGIALLIAVYNLQLMLHRQVNVGAMPGWTMWAAQSVMLAIGVFLWRRVEIDRMPKLFSVVGEWLYLLRQQLNHRIAHRWSK